MPFTLCQRSCSHQMRMCFRWGVSCKSKISHIRSSSRIYHFAISQSNVSHFITNYTTYSLTNALNQALIGLLTNYPIGRQAQAELDKLVRSSRIGVEDVKGLVVLPAVVEEAIRRSLIVGPMDTLYQVEEDTWYKTYFVPKRSLIIFDQDEIFPPGSRLSDDEVRSQTFDRD